MDFFNSGSTARKIPTGNVTAFTGVRRKKLPIGRRIEVLGDLPDRTPRTRQGSTDFTVSKAAAKNRIATERLEAKIEFDRKELENLRAQYIFLSASDKLDALVAKERVLTLIVLLQKSIREQSETLEKYSGELSSMAGRKKAGHVR